MSVSAHLVSGFTQIGWTEWSYNPYIGCVEVSPGCQNCYANQQWGAGSRFNRATWGSERAGGTRSVVSPMTFSNPFRWHKLASETANLWALDLEPGELYPLVQSKAKRPGELKHWALLDQMGLLERVGDAVMCRDVPWRNPTVFCASLADIFEDWTGPMLDHKGEQLFWSHEGGKYGPGRVWSTTQSGLGVPITMDSVREAVLEMIDLTPDLTWLLLTKRIENVAAVFRDAARPNVMIGTSIENQAMADRRIPHLLEAERHGVGTFISAEPLLGPVNLRAYYQGRTKPGWVIAGCESGPSARPCDNRWIMGVVDGARDAGVPVFVKQAMVDGELVRSLASLPTAIRYQDKPGFYEGQLV